MMTDGQIEEFKADLVTKGEGAVRANLIRDVYDEMRTKLVIQFLDECEAKRAAKDRGEDLEIGREANRLSGEAVKAAHTANWVSLVAAGIAVLALIVAALAYGRP